MRPDKVYLRNHWSSDVCLPQKHCSSDPFPNILEKEPLYTQYRYPTCKVWAHLGNNVLCVGFVKTLAHCRVTKRGANRLNRGLGSLNWSLGVPSILGSLQNVSQDPSTWSVAHKSGVAIKVAKFLMVW
jgi:hypothetical protein